MVTKCTNPNTECIQPENMALNNSQPNSPFELTAGFLGTVLHQNNAVFLIIEVLYTLRCAVFGVSIVYSDERVRTDLG